MEVEGEDGSKIVLQNAGDKVVFGRGFGFNTKDKTVSRRHVVFELAKSGESQTGSNYSKVSFEVVGKNPMWVREHGSGEIRVFRKGEKGDVAEGDWLCFLSGKRPVWFAVRESEFGVRAEKRVLESEIGLGESLGGGFEFDDGVDVEALDIDPVKEFGFLVMGHEFDHYPKQMLRDIRNWDWFLEEPKRDSDDDEYLEKSGKRGVMKRRRKAAGNDDDDDFTGESDDDKELVAKLRKVDRPKYSTRSKDHDKPHKEAKGSKNSLQKTTRGANEDDDDDETLGGFIVEEDDVEQEEETDEDEEEFVEDDDEEEVDD
ncbi:hypothetical protein CMV_013563 [Castanea mollissima]|uniref:Uncharacterized protein n=1 Tax=Castanea mollissima TaxID=60419 RepID=A0A8J4RCW9_9ROSI|nr:hypothetical protein CMV_013563 [Castanea mollissima]